MTRSIARHATAALAVRTLINLTLLIHPLRTPTGRSGTVSQQALREALSEVSLRIVIGGLTEVASVRQRQETSLRLADVVDRCHG